GDTYTDPSYPNPFTQYALPQTSFPGDLSWGYNDTDMYAGWGAQSPAAQPGVIVWSQGTPPDAIHLADITDGTSNTLLLGEFEPKYNERYYKWDSDPSISQHMALETPRFGGWTNSVAYYAWLAGSTVVPINWPINDQLTCNYNNWGGKQPVATLGN